VTGKRASVREKGTYSRRGNQATAWKRGRRGNRRWQDPGGGVQHVGGWPQGSKAASRGARDSSEGNTLKGESHGRQRDETSPRNL